MLNDGNLMLMCTSEEQVAKAQRLKAVGGSVVEEVG